MLRLQNITVVLGQGLCADPRLETREGGGGISGLGNTAHLCVLTHKAASDLELLPEAPGCLGVSHLYTCGPTVEVDSNDKTPSQVP
jgi:hypothetical protein